ncbi:MAG: universal stress protein [Cyanobacteria bacterium J06639_1]
MGIIFKLHVIAERAEAELSMKFLVAIDGSEAGRHALTRALELARGQTEASFVLLSVVEPATDVYYPDMMPGTTDFGTSWQGVSAQELMDVARDRSRKALEEAETLCQKAGLACVSHVKLGTPRTTICDVAAEEAPDVLAIGSRGLGTMERLLLGSVSDYVVHHAPCPVLVVR